MPNAIKQIINQNKNQKYGIGAAQASSLPSVNADDNGKSLVVENGRWVVSSGAALEKENVIAPQQTVTIVDQPVNIEFPDGYWLPNELPSTWRITVNGVKLEYSREEGGVGQYTGVDEAKGVTYSCALFTEDNPYTVKFGAYVLDEASGTTTFVPGDYIIETIVDVVSLQLPDPTNILNGATLEVREGHWVVSGSHG